MAMSLAQDTWREVEGRVVRLAESPITFEQFLDMTGEDDELELVNGVLVERMSASTPHEERCRWLDWVLTGYVDVRGLGVVLGSRSAVEINAFQARVPDILFVRADRRSIVQNRALYGAPDLVIEVVSPNDRPSDLLALQADYRSLGVEEILFLDTQKRSLLVLRRRGSDYDANTLTSGTFHSETVAGFHFELEDLFQDSLPSRYRTLTALLAETPPEESV